MKKTEILKQSYELSNDLDNEAMFVGLKAQINSKVFKELINGEKHSLTLEFRVFVNEEEREDKDPDYVKAMEFVALFNKFAKTKPDPIKLGLEAGNIDLFQLWMKSGEIDTRQFEQSKVTPDELLKRAYENLKSENNELQFDKNQLLSEIDRKNSAMETALELIDSCAPGFASNTLIAAIKDTLKTKMQ